MKKWVIFFYPLTMISLFGCSSQLNPSQAETTINDISNNVEEKTTEVITTTAESLSETTSVESSAMSIYTSTEIFSWSNPVDPLEKGLIDIIHLMKKEKRFIDMTEYLFIVEEDTFFQKANVEVLANYSDQQLHISSYQIDYQTETIEQLERNDE